MTSTLSKSTSNAHLRPSAPVFQPGKGVSATASKNETNIQDHTSASTKMPVGPSTNEPSVPLQGLGRQRTSSLNPLAATFSFFQPAAVSAPQLFPPLPPQMSLGVSPALSPAGPVSPQASAYSSSSGYLPPFPAHDVSALQTSPQQSFGVCHTLPPFAMAGSGTQPGTAGRKGRGRREIPPVQPFKVTGHNGKPSVSLNAAALTQLLATQRPKRKAVVRLPRELPSDNDVHTDLCLATHDIDEEEEGDADDGDMCTSESVVKRIRRAWKKRVPLLDVPSEVAGDDMPLAAICSLDRVDDAALSKELPDFIDIYLPGHNAWEELIEALAVQRIKQSRRDTYSREVKETIPTLDTAGAALSERINADDQEEGHVGASSSSPRRIKPLAMRGKSLQHTQAMSLSLPPPGRPFAHTALTAMGLPSPVPGSEMRRSSSDPAHLHHSNLVPGQSNASSGGDHRTFPKNSPPPSWKAIGRGFGYEIQEADEDQEDSDSLARTTRRLAGAKVDHLIEREKLSTVSEGSSGAPVADICDWQEKRRQISGNGSDSNEDEDNDDDIENKSRGGDTTYDSDDSNDNNDGDDDDSDLTYSNSLSEEFSNPSDEEAARQARLNRRAIRAERQAGLAIAKARQRSAKKTRSRRKRSNTGETYASSALQPREDYEVRPRGYSLTSRGPLDDVEAVNTLRTRSSDVTSSHFRLPSIKASSFGSGFAPHHSAKSSLNATAPAFVPGSFTFQAPNDAPRIPSLVQSYLFETEQGEVMDQQAISRESQGREKRQRQRNEYVVDDLATFEGPSLWGGSVPATSVSQSHSVSLASGNTLKVKPSSTAFQPIRGGYTSHLRPSLSTFNATSEVMRSESDVLADCEDDPRNDQENANEQMSRPVSATASIGHRTPLSSVLQQQNRADHFNPLKTATPSTLSRQATRQSEAKSAAKSTATITRGQVEREVDSDDETVSDIIEELGDRMDRSLEGWAGRILDEVTIMGQVRPLNVVALEAHEKQALAAMIRSEVQQLLEEQSIVLAGKLRSRGPEDAMAAEVADATKRTLEERNPASMTSGDGQEIGLSTNKMAVSESPGEVQMQQKSDHLLASVGSSMEQKIMPQVNEGIAEAVQRARDQLQPTQPSSLAREWEPFADSIARKMQVMLDASVTSQSRISGDTTALIQPMLDQHLQSEVVRRREDVDLVRQAILSKAERLEKVVQDLRDGLAEEMEARLRQSVLPAIQAQYERHGDTSTSANAIVHFDAEKMSKNIALGTAEILARRWESQDTTDSISTYRKALVPAEEHLDRSSNMDVIALLTQKQEEGRELTQTVSAAQSEMRNMLADMPGALDAKLDTLLSSSRTIQECHEAILKKLDCGVGARLDTPEEIARLTQSRDELTAELASLRRQHEDVRDELEEARVEIATSTEHSDTLKEECSRLEARLDLAEKDAKDIEERASHHRRREQELTERLTLAEGRAADLLAKEKEWIVEKRLCEEHNTLLKGLVDQLSDQMAVQRGDFDRERELLTRAIAEALAGRKEIEHLLIKEREASEKARTQLQQFEQAARIDQHHYIEKASKAEGHIVSLEKRLADQDSKVANLQHLTATQKQKAAQNGQKLAEVEKKLKDLGDKDRELIEAHTRLRSMESRAASAAEMEAALKASQESEDSLRDENGLLQARFLELEKDVLSMKESFVEREILHEAQQALADSRQEVTILKTKLTESSRRGEEADVVSLRLGGTRHLNRSQSGSNPMTMWSHSPSHASSTWASVHAPSPGAGDHSTSLFIDESLDSFNPVERSTSQVSASRVIEVDEDGWWS